MDYVSVADRAEEILGEPNVARAEEAFNAMVTDLAYTETYYENERTALSRLGAIQGDQILSAIEQNVPDRVSRMMRSDVGINLADPSSKALVANLVSGSVLTQEQADALLEPVSGGYAKWPSLTLEYVADALRRRAAGSL